MVVVVSQTSDYTTDSTITDRSMSFIQYVIHQASGHGEQGITSSEKFLFNIVQKHHSAFHVFSHLRSGYWIHSRLTPESLVWSMLKQTAVLLTFQLGIFLMQCAFESHICPCVSYGGLCIEWRSQILNKQQPVSAGSWTQQTFPPISFFTYTFGLFLYYQLSVMSNDV